ncbi:MAG: hypothetical protein AAF085_13470 [Planctomycetota bacterium]
MGLTEVWEAYKATGLEESLGEEAGDELYERMRMKCIAAIGQGLADFRESNPAYKDAALILMIPDDETTEEMKQIMAKINPQWVSDSFAALDAFLNSD